VELAEWSWQSGAGRVELAEWSWQSGTVMLAVADLFCLDELEFYLCYLMFGVCHCVG
jgi:hypothetical protein